MTFRTRFAPSPTGPLHLGHAYSALLGFDMAVASGGEWLLRIEDIDRARSRPGWEQQIYEDLDWLGLRWPEPAMRQSERLGAYEEALERLWDEDGLLFDCVCSRSDILAAARAPQEGGGPIIGPEGLLYPGTCKGQRPRPVPFRDVGREVAIRLDMAQALSRHGDQEHREERRADAFREDGAGPNGEHGVIAFTADELVRCVGDVVLARRGVGTSYHLSVVLDDAAQCITHVVRGQDLFEATKIHVVLQRLLGLPTPTYHHHRLVRDERGRRLAKREDAKAIRRFREEGATPGDVRRMVGL